MCCWARTRIHPTLPDSEEIPLIISAIAPFIGEDPGELGKRGIKELLNHLEEARSVVGMCIWSLRREVVDVGLAHLFMISTTLVQLCPRETYDGMTSYWARLLAAAARACERQLCSGDDTGAGATEYETFPCGYTVFS